jgi:ferric-dicitrate binding protein FerR (iron transport regulator)
MIASDGDDRADRALRKLATSAVPVEYPGRIAERRARLVPALSAFADAEMQRASRRPGWRRMIGLAAAVAMALAVTVWFLAARTDVAGAMLRASEGTVRVLHGGVASRAAAGTPLALREADLLETVDGTAVVSLVTGAVVDLGARSRIELSAVDRKAGAVSERLVLSSGRVDVRVPKLKAGSKLMIGTPDALVTVHGTAFSVEVTKAPDGLRTTTVVVTEGLVSVDSGGRQLLLGPGSHWSSAPRASAAQNPIETAPVEIGPSPSASSEPGSIAGGRRSTLGAENELFRAAMAARRDGNPEKVLLLTDRLLHAYPGTPLGSDARALRAEALEKLGRVPYP